jgi:hypothetical protein
MSPAKLTEVFPDAVNGCLYLYREVISIDGRTIVGVSPLTGDNSKSLNCGIEMLVLRESVQPLQSCLDVFVPLVISPKFLYRSDWVAVR